jgi:hypothetical protein
VRAFSLGVSSRFPVNLEWTRLTMLLILAAISLDGGGGGGVDGMESDGASEEPSSV